MPSVLHAANRLYFGLFSSLDRGCIEALFDPRVDSTGLDDTQKKTRRAQNLILSFTELKLSFNSSLPELLL